eukprot:2337023-Prymnesium_polylepis.4
MCRLSILSFALSLSSQHGLGRDPRVLGEFRAGSRGLLCADEGVASVSACAERRPSMIGAVGTAEGAAMCGGAFCASHRPR